MTTSGQMPSGRTGSGGQTGSGDQPGSGGGPPSDRRIERLLAIYDDVHRSIVNRTIHRVTVPVMTWCVLAFLSAMPFPDSLSIVPGLSWGVVGAIAISVYYLLLSPVLAAGMAALCIACLSIAAIVARGTDTPLWQVALFVYVIAWAVQLLGYRLEARPPTFREDARFLVIGPAWLIAGIYRLLGIGY